MLQISEKEALSSAGTLTDNLITACRHDEFACKTGYGWSGDPLAHCIHEQLVCDGYHDCLNDEINCGEGVLSIH